MDVKKQPVVIVFSILAALQVLNGGLALIDTIPKDVAAIISLVIGAVTAGASFSVRAGGLVDPGRARGRRTRVGDGAHSTGRSATGAARGAEGVLSRDDRRR
jgi:hypothetical protein